MKAVRRALVLLLALTMVLGLLPATAAGTGNADGYYTVDEYKSKGSYPTREGMVFAGWFTDESCTVPFKEKTGRAFARFTDAKVLSVKWQIKSGTTSASAGTDLRLVSTVDSLDYQQVGFRIQVQDQDQKRVGDTVYKDIAGWSQGSYLSYQPTTFSPSSLWFVTYRLNDVGQSLFDKPFTVTPLWVTLDGTEVTGTPTTFRIDEDKDFVKVAGHTVTFDPNYEGAEKTTATAETGKPVAKPADPTRSGYTFLGWFTQKEGGSKYDFTQAVTGDLTLYAQWKEGETPADSHTVTFDLNYEGARSMEPATVKNGETASKPTDPAREGYVFQGWFTQKEGGSAYDFAQAVTGDLTLYAQWKAAETGGKVTVIFDLNYEGAEANIPVETDAGTTVRPPNDPSRDGYKFQGWFTKPKDGDKFDLSQPVTEGIRLYAQWEVSDIPEYLRSVTFVLNYPGAPKSPAPSRQETGKKATKPPDPTREGYTFEGWYTGSTNNTPFDFEQEITENTTAYAHWKLNRSGPTPAALTRQAVDMGEYHSAAIRSDGSLWLWGSNTGRLGTGDDKERLTPVNVMSDVKAVSLGSYHTAALKTDGTLWAWGSSYANGTDHSTNVPGEVMKDVTAVAAGSGCTLALKTDGGLWAWGSNSNGELGNGTTERNIAPIQVPIAGKVKAVSAGLNYAAAITEDGSLWTWGKNNKGQLGDGTQEDRHSPVKVQGLSNVIAVSLRDNNTFAITADGSLWGWGYAYDTAKFADRSFKEDAALTPVKIPLEGKAVAVSTGWSHTLVLTDDSTLWSLGGDNYNKLSGDYIPYDDSYKPAKLMEDVVAISAGWDNCAAVTADGKLWTWGRNSSGQLGDGTKTSETVPFSQRVCVMDGLT